jgi:hypothetical protein
MRLFFSFQKEHKEKGKNCTQKVYKSESEGKKKEREYCTKKKLLNNNSFLNH